MGYQPGVMMADLAIPTVAAFVPNDFKIDICDEHISKINFEIDSKFIGITGRVYQKNRMIEIAKEFKKRGKIIIMGGSYVTLSPNVMREYCDILVQGEIEEIHTELFNDLRNNTYKDTYYGTKADLALTPTPRWDLYPNNHASAGSIQTSRGCPYQCEFCDVIVYLGRKQRHKPIDDVIKELEVLYSLGYRSIVFSDDNFTVNRPHAKKLLKRLRDWNLKHKKSPVRFCTQVSTDIVKDDELLQLCAQAGFDQVFIGIESPNSESMTEVKKFHNTKLEMTNVIKKFYNYGILPYCGMILGFDSDYKNIFKEQFELAMDSFSPYFMINVLIAPDQTPLYNRLKKENRIITNRYVEVGSPLNSNIIFKNFSTDEMNLGMKWLATNLYEPKNFTLRVLNMLDNFNTYKQPKSASQLYEINGDHILKDISKIISKIKNLGEEEKKMWNIIGEKIIEKNAPKELFITLMFFYMQLRHVYNENGIWQPELIGADIDFKK